MVDPNFHTVSTPKSLAELAEIAGGTLSKGADPDQHLNGVAPLDAAGASEISFLDNAKYIDDFKATKAAACIVSPEMESRAPKGCALILSKNPYKSYALVAQAFYPVVLPPAGIADGAHVHSKTKISDGCIIEAGAVIAEGVKLGKGCWIESNAVIGRNVELGENCRVGANTSISYAIIGAGTRLYPGVRVGQDGFGFAIDPAGHVKVPQLGRVIIGDHVEIGANSCIDRGAGPDTIIGDGTWIDNCVQIGHNAKIGKGCVLVGQCGIAGSATLEDYVVVAAQAGIGGHLTVGQGARIAGQSGVIRDVPAGSEMMGSPALPLKQKMRQIAWLKRMSESKS